VTVASGSGNVLFTDGFDGGLGGWAIVGNVSLDSGNAPPAGSPPSARTALAGQVGDLTRTLAAPEPRVCTTVSVLLSALPAGTTTLNLVKYRTAANVSIARVYVTAAGKLSARSDIAGTTFTTAAALPVGSWHDLQLCVTTAATGTMSLTLDGSTVKSWSVNTGTTAIDRVQLGDDAARTAVANYDDVVATR
jgi:hypothetical protein